MASASTQMVMPFAASTSYLPEDFLRGSANEAALALLDRWPDWPYSMVVLHGPAGSGKTHLAHVFAQRAQAMFVPPERIGELPAEQLLAGSHAWVIDGIEHVQDEAALAQLINLARARGDCVLMTASHAPSKLKVALNDLRSRLSAMPEVALGLPDEALLMGVLAKHFADLQLRVPPEVLAYTVARLERSFAAVQYFAQRIDKASLVAGKKVSLALAAKLLA